MDDRTLQGIKQHLQDKDAQNRILKNIERARSEATVTIGRAAELFGFTENQLRDWEARGLVCPNKSPGGQRLYPLTELDRLAVIRELLNTKFSPGDIPKDINHIWYALNPPEGRKASLPMSDIGHLPIDQRVDQNDHNVFSQYFVSQVLRISLLLICEDMPDTIAGLVLPIQQSERIYSNDPKDLQRIGLSLVGWLTRNRTFHAFLDPTPSFEFPSDFRIEHLRIPDANIYPFTPYIVIQRRSLYLAISPVLTETIYRLLQLVYSQMDQWQSSFQPGMRDYVYQVADFSAGQHISDPMLNDLMDMIVELGGQTSDAKDRWSFSCLVMPQDASLPLQQRNLVVRAHSKRVPERWNTLMVSKNNPGLSFRAFQSGHVVYRPNIPPGDHILANRETEESTRSAMAIPVAGENGIAIATLYIASDEVEAFSEADQRVLRFITRMIEELLSTYQSRQQVAGKLTNLLNNPSLVDLSFREFLSEDDFINDLEAFLETIQERNDIEPKSRPDPGSDLWFTTNEAVSFIAIDIDNQGSLATKYGDQVARNLSREVGMRIRRQLSILSNPEYRKLYHVNADNYYIKLVGMSLKEARKLALTLLNLLRGEYLIDARRVVMGRPLKREDMLELSNVKVRLAVSSYPFAKLKELLIRYVTEGPVETTRALILENIDVNLKRGQAEGGDRIISWYPENEIWSNGLWSPNE